MIGGLLSSAPPAGFPTDAFLSLLADPEATKRRLKELIAASAEAVAATEQARAAQAELPAQRAAHAKAIKAEREQHDAALATSRKVHEAKCTKREEALDQRERLLAEREAKAAADAEAAARLKTTLEMKLKRINDVAAAAA
jgi:hypothetical protein